MRCFVIRCVFTATCASIVFGFAASRLSSAEEPIDFERDVAPILETRCLGCHIGLTARAHLSIENLESLLEGGDSGPAIDPGSAEDSLLLHMISGDGPEMPKDAEPLTEAEVAAIARWIDGGAVWPKDKTLVDRSREGPWWSLKPLVRPEVPLVASDWQRTPIDAFILTRLEEHELQPAPEADRGTLIRRLSFDLLGLPPTPEAVDAFVADTDPLAYERLVDRLLASPHYGERWARHWLDVVHYAETHGYDKDKRRDHSWPYRDYVVRALNEDRPYDQFILEQIAGDVLFPKRAEAIVATGFIAAGPWDFVGHVELSEGTIEKKKTRLIDRDDMLATTIGTFASMTIHCARCHDHPFDPIPQQDYYALQAVFAGVDRGNRGYPDAEVRRKRELVIQQRDAAKKELEELLAQRDALTSSELTAIDTELSALAEEIEALDDPWTSEGKPVMSPTNGYHSAIAQEAETTKWVQLDLGSDQPIDLVRLIPARPTDFPDAPGFGFPLRFQVTVATDNAPNDWQIVLDESREDFPNPGDHDLVILLNSLPARYVRVTATKLWERTNDFALALAEMHVVADGQNVALEATVSSADTIDAGRWHTDHLIDGFSSRHRLTDPASAEQMTLARTRQESTRRQVELTKQRTAVFESLIPDILRQQIAAGEGRLAELNAKVESLPTEPLVYAVKPLEPRPIHVLRRGDVQQPLEAAEPGTLACVASLPARFTSISSEDEGARRAALARWLADPANILVWRSIANRLWHYHFGRGIVDTPNDFGRNGSRPSHPALLDWLAGELLTNGKSLKSLHRLIVTSAVYRQSSRYDETYAEQDGENRFLWRMNRRRLDAESFRDAVLATSGRLDTAMGGKSFELFDFEDDHSPRYDYTPTDRPAGRRRTLYRCIVRSVPNPFLEALDCPDPSLSAPVRQTTITPLQALATMNDSFVLREAQHLAERIESQQADIADQVETAYRTVLLRSPSDEELTVLQGFVQKHSLAAACRLLLNTSEFSFVD